MDRLRERAREDDELAQTLVFLADDQDIDAFARPSDAVLAGVQRINTRRQAEQRRALAGRSLSSAEVVDLIASISDRKAVDRRRHRGRLLGVKVGNGMLHPDWQFDQRRGETRAGLGRVLEALREVTSDATAAHALMVAPRPDLGGRSLADLFADGDPDPVVELVLLAGDQS